MASKTPEEYLKTLNSKGLDIIENIIRQAKEIEPKIELSMGYGVLALRAGKKVVYLAAFKNHVGIYPGADTIEYFAKDLTGFETAKGTIRIPMDEPIPYPLIEKIVRYVILKKK